MKVWKITEADGNGAPLFIDRMAIWDKICGGLDNEETGNQYLIEVIDIDPDKFDGLPEWGGF